MKLILSILVVFIATFSYAQVPVNAPVVQRSTPGNTVQDARLFAQYNLGTPRYLDTVAANVASNVALDSCSAIIFTYDVNAIWVRACNPKRWIRVDGQQVLPDGVYSGGDVGWTGIGLDFFETAAIFILNHVIYNTPTVNPLPLDPSDPVFNRIDLIGLGPTGPVVITGTPAASPQEPSYNPQIFIRRAAVLVEAGALTPTIITDIIYDENLGLPDEWAATNTGGTVDFANTTFPYHLTVCASVSVFDSSNRIKFNYSDTVHTVSKGSIVGFLRLASIMPDNQNLFIQLFYQGVAVSVRLPFTGSGMFRNVISQYQPLVFAAPSFGASDIIFDEIRVIPTGGGAFPAFKLDFIQFQAGFSPAVSAYRFGIEDNVATSDRNFDFNSYNFRFSNIRKFVISSNTTSSTDSLFVINQSTGGVPLLRVSDDDNFTYLKRADIATGKFLAYETGVDVHDSIPFSMKTGAWVQGYQQPLILRRAYPINETSGYTYGVVLDNDTLTGIGSFTDSSNYVIFNPRYTNHTNGISTEKYRYFGDGTMWRLALPYNSSPTTADSILIKKNGFDVGLKISDLQTLLGSGSVTNIAFNTATGIRSTSEPITTTGTIRIDTTIIATRAWAQSIAGGGGFTGVTSFTFTDGDGFDGTVLTSTSTPVLSLKTTLSAAQIPYIAAGLGLAGSSNFTWTNATNRLGVGATSAAYLSLAASTTAQASLNLGNAGTAPTSPQNADVWVASNHVNVRLNGVTYQLDQQSAAGVATITGTANQVIASAATGPVTLSLPQSIATTSNVIFQRGSFTGAGTTANLILGSHTDPTAAAGVLTNNGTSLLFSFATTYKKFLFTNNVVPTNGQIAIGNGVDYTVSAISASNNSFTVTNGVGSITLGLNMAPQTLTDGATITWNAANGFNATVTLGGTGRTLARSNWVAGATYTLRIVQDGTGNRTITTWPANTRWPAGAAPTLSTTAGAINIVSWYYDGINCYGAYTNSAYQ